jgi:hypothetical protein
MTLDELKARLDGLEWNDIEFKEAAWQVPRDIYEKFRTPLSVRCTSAESSAAASHFKKIC